MTEKNNPIEILKAVVLIFLILNIIKDENNTDPIAPEMVLLGLILVNFGPLNIFPIINPPKSDAAHVNKIRKIKIFK